jgi:hypothetical protein
MTEEMKQKILEDFTEALNNIKMSEGKLSYSKSFKYEGCRAVVCLTPVAYKKIIALVTSFTDEVGWHGTAIRTADNEFTINDIFVYPQEVSGSTVNTKQDEYTQWLYGLNDDVFNNLRMHGHSHYNMGVSPSGVDDEHKQKLLDQLEADMFYIFMIWNRSLFEYTLVYDMARNIMYEDKDIDVKVLGDDGLGDFLPDAKAKVIKQGQRKKEGNADKTGKTKNYAKTNNSAKNNASTTAYINTLSEQEGYALDPWEYGYLSSMKDYFDLGGKEWRP